MNKKASTSAAQRHATRVTCYCGEPLPVPERVDQGHGCTCGRLYACSEIHYYSYGDDSSVDYKWRCVLGPKDKP